MNIARGICMLPISAVMMGRMETIYPVLIWDNDSVILVDTGYPGQLPLIKEQVERAGLTLDKLSKIIITHGDIDHIGSLPDLLKAVPHKVEVLASEIEKPFIEGEKRPLKITDESIEQAVKALPPEVPEQWRASFRKVLEQPPSAPVDTIIEDKLELPDCEGIIVISTPGHTPGHICLYHKASKTLIAADAMNILNDQLTLPTPELCTDPEQAKQSLRNLLAYDIKTVVCYHGGLLSGGITERIRALIEE